HKPEIKDEARARAIVADALKLPFKVAADEDGARRRPAPPPYRTSTLQQEAAKQLGSSAAVTMRLAQQLYEGIEIGPEGPVGLITYMRTDSIRVADSAVAQARDFIAREFDKRYLPATPNVHKTGKGQSRVQDAHEAIRPTDVLRRPDDLKQHLDAKQFKLYQLIWRRFVASQMNPAVFETTKVDFDLGRFVFRAIISTLKNRWYATAKDRRFQPTPQGEIVWQVLKRCFPDVFEVGFTAQMETELDKVEEGDLAWQRVLEDFWGPFSRALAAVDIDRLIHDVHDLSELPKEKCPNCGGPLIVKSGRFG